MGSLFDKVLDPFGDNNANGWTGPFADPLDLSGNQAGAAANKAAKGVVGAAQAAADEQRRQSEITNANLKPWVTAGTGALGIQQDLTGVNGAAAQQAAMGNLNPTPGQLFLQRQNEKALLAKAAATGGLGGGNVRADLNKLGVLNAAENFNTDYNRFAGISGTGQTAGSNLAGLGQQSASSIANLQQQAGDARASGILGAGQAQAAGLQNIAGLGAGIYGMFPHSGSTIMNAGVQPSGATTYAAPSSGGYLYEGPK